MPSISMILPAGSTPLDHTSVLKTVEQRWSLQPLTARDAAAPGVGDVLTLTTPRTAHADSPKGGVTRTSVPFEPTTRMVWVETPTNPLLRVVDIEAVARVAHARNAVVTQQRRDLAQ